MTATIWLLTVLSLPASGDGLIMGWSAPYPSQADCRRAQAQVTATARKAPSATHNLYAACQPR